MPENIILTAAEEDSGSRIDKYISDNIAQLTRSSVQGLISAGAVLADGKAVSKNYKLRGGEEISVEIPDPWTLSRRIYR